MKRKYNELFLKIQLKSLGMNQIHQIISTNFSFIQTIKCDIYHTFFQILNMVFDIMNLFFIINFLAKYNFEK